MNNAVDWPYIVPAIRRSAGLTANIQGIALDLAIRPVRHGLGHNDILLHDIAGKAIVVGNIPQTGRIEIYHRDFSRIRNLDEPICSGRCGASQIERTARHHAEHLCGICQIQQGDELLHDETGTLTIGGSVPCAVKFGNDQQGFVGNAREDGSGRIRRHSKIEATASDGAENAGDHFVTSFLVFGHRKGGASKRSSAQEDKGNG